MQTGLRGWNDDDLGRRMVAWFSLYTRSLEILLQTQAVNDLLPIYLLSILEVISQKSFPGFSDHLRFERIP